MEPEFHEETTSPHFGTQDTIRNQQDDNEFCDYQSSVPDEGESFYSTVSEPNLESEPKADATNAGENPWTAYSKLNAGIGFRSEIECHA